MALARLPDWQSRLAQFLLAHRSTPFSYGRFDCCLFVCDAITAMTGTDPAARFRGTYSSLKEARRYGSVRKITEQVTTEFEMPEIPVLRAQRGDIVLIKRSRDYSLGLVGLSGSIAVLIKSGFTHIPLTQA